MGAQTANMETELNCKLGHENFYNLNNVIWQLGGCAGFVVRIN